MGATQGIQGQQEWTRPHHYFFPPYPYLTIKRAAGVLLILPQNASPHMLERFQINSGRLTRPGVGTYQLATLPPADWEAVWDIRHFYNNWQHGGASQLNDPQIIAWLQRQVNDGRLAAFWLPDETGQGQISLSPADTAPVHVPPAVHDVAQWSIRHKIIAMFQAVPKYLDNAAKAQFEAFLTPQNLALLAGIFVAVAAVQAVPGADAAVDLILTGLAWAMYGWAGPVAVRDLIEAVIKAARAQNQSVIDQAAQLAAEALVVLGVTLFLERLADRGKEGNSTGLNQLKESAHQQTPVARPKTNDMLPNFGRGYDQPNPDDLEPTTSTSTSSATILPTGDGQSFTSDSAFSWYMSKAQTLDVSTAENSSVFYSGPGNRALAEAFAAANGRTTLEMTPGGSWLDAQGLFGPSSLLTPSEATQVWSTLSGRFAAGAS